MRSSILSQVLQLVVTGLTTQYKDHELVPQKRTSEEEVSDPPQISIAALEASEVMAEELHSAVGTVSSATTN